MILESCRFFLCLLLIGITSVALAIDLPVISPGTDQSEIIKRTAPQGESVQDTADNARRLLKKQALSNEHTNTKAGLKLPISWLGLPDCARLKKLQIHLKWFNTKAEKQDKLYFQKNLSLACDSHAIIETSISKALADLRKDGLIVTRTTLNELSFDGIASVDVYLISLSKVRWYDGSENVTKYGWTPALGEPLRLIDFDGLIERVGRLRRNNVHIDVNPDASLDFAEVVVKNVEGSPFRADIRVFSRPNLSTVASDLLLENVAGLGEVWILSNQYSKLPNSGSFKSNALRFEVPFAAQLIDISITKNRTFIPILNTNSSTLNLETLESNLKFALNRVAYRDPQSVLTWSPSLTLKKIDSNLQGVSVESLSPHLSVLGLDFNFRHLTDSNSVIVFNINLNKGLRCCKETDDNVTGATDPNAAHAQFTSVLASAIYSKPLKLDDRNVQLFVAGQAFYSALGLYPAQEFSLASPSAVDGIFNAQSLVDRGWSVKLGLSTNWLIKEINQPLQTTVSYGYATGKRYFEGISPTLHGASFELAVPFKMGKITVAAFLPGHNQYMSKENMSMSVNLGLSF